MWDPDLQCEIEDDSSYRCFKCGRKIRKIPTTFSIPDVPYEIRWGNLTQSTRNQTVSPQICHRCVKRIDEEFQMDVGPRYEGYCNICKRDRLADTALVKRWNPSRLFFWREKKVYYICRSCRNKLAVKCCNKYS